MSLTRSHGLLQVAKTAARDLRKRSTDSEIRLWTELRSRRLNGKKFLRQHPIIVDDDGRETFLVADFYCAEKKLIVEIDGPIHEFQKAADAQRARLLTRRGLQVLRLSSAEIEKGMEKALEKIRQKL